MQIEEYIADKITALCEKRDMEKIEEYGDCPEKGGI